MSGAAPEHAALSPRRAVYLIARREFATRIRGKVFIIGTIVAVALLALYAVLQLAVIDRINTTTTFKVGFSGPATALAQPLEAAAPSLGFKVHVSDVATEAQGRSEVRVGQHRCPRRGGARRSPGGGQDAGSTPRCRPLSSRSPSRRCSPPT